MRNYGIFVTAKNYFKQQNYKKYHEVMSQLYEIESNDLTIKYEYGKSLVKVGKFGRAIEIFEELLDTKNWMLALHELALIDIRNRDYEEAINKLQKILDSKPDDQFVIREYARVLMRLKKVDEAIEMYDRLTEPGFYVAAKIELSSVKMNQGKLEEAENDLKNAINLTKEPNNLYEAYYQYGMLKNKQKDYFGAIEMFEKSLKFKKVLATYTELAHTYMAVNMPYKAEEVFIKGWEEYGHTPFALELAKKYKEEKKFDEALKLLKSISDPTYIISAKIYIGKIYFCLNRGSEGIDLFNRLWEETHDVKALIELIKYNNNLGLHDKALELLDKNKGFENDKFYRFEYGRTLFYMGLYKEAYEIFKNNIEVFDDKFNKKFFIYCSLRLGLYKEAYEYLKQISKIESPFNKDDYSRLIVYIKFKLGITDDSKTDFYFLNQLTNYSKEEAIKHISKHLYENENKLSHTTYHEDVDVIKLYDIVSERLDGLKTVSKDVCDTYEIEFENSVGKLNGIEIFKVYVLTLPDSKNILTIYPRSKLLKEDIEKDLEKNKDKVRRKSRVDWFNERYNIKKN